jgi:hypothetical protein
VRPASPGAGRAGGGRLRISPVVVYQERPDTGGPHYGFTILYGYPYRDPEEWGCFQLSQREVCRGSDHYYDVTRPGELDQLERDFLDFTVAVAARYSTGLELARALQHGEIPSSQPERKGVGLVRDLLDIAQAHGLDGVRQEVFAMARQLDSSRESHDDVRELAEFRPELASVLGPEDVGLRRRRRRWRSGT